MYNYNNNYDFNYYFFYNDFNYYSQKAVVEDIEAVVEVMYLKLKRHALII